MTSPPPARRSRGTVVVAILIALVALAASVVLYSPQLVGLQRTAIVAQAIAFRVPVVIGATALLLFLLIGVTASRGARRLLGPTAAVLAVFVVASTAVIGMRGIGDPYVPAATGDGEIRVLSWNTRGDEPGSPEIAQLALTLETNVVVLPETTEQMGVEVAALMAEAGTPMQVLTRTIDEEYRATSTTLLISPELGQYDVVTDAGDTGTLPTVIATPADGDGPTIVAAHPVSPTPGNMASWRDDLDWLAQLCSGDAIVAGDFNATLDHLAGLESAGLGPDHAPFDFGECTDGARTTGNGAVGTWTTGLPPVLGAPIDHVMATGEWRFTGFAVITTEDLAGSDHRPVFAELTRV